MESLDIVFVSKFISKRYAPSVIENLIEIFNDALIDDMMLKMDIGVILGGMVLKHVKDIRKQNRLLGELNMVEYENELQVLVYDEFGDVIVKKDEEIEAKNRELGQKNKEIDELIKSNKEYKDKIKQLNDMDDLSEEAKKIISSLI